MVTGVQLVSNIWELGVTDRMGTSENFCGIYIIHEGFYTYLHTLQTYIYLRWDRYIGIINRTRTYQWLLYSLRRLIFQLDDRSGV